MRVSLGGSILTFASSAVIINISSDISTSDELMLSLK
ncbi:MAG: hypothetical protein BWX92_02958 [Deltaproteobacteria bacterium ADurb.Bin135]|nr:MAG: hypothetical protein BWX92_02958 [Deltaproteobacteria bacterium ADurb.Bin135]